MEQFSIKVAEEWKIGQKGKDSGAILSFPNRTEKPVLRLVAALRGS